MDNLAAQFLLDPAVTFLNHGSFGACPRPVFARYQEWQLQLERQAGRLPRSRARLWQMDEVRARGAGRVRGGPTPPIWSAR